MGTSQPFRQEFYTNEQSNLILKCPLCNSTTTNTIKIRERPETTFCFTEGDQSDYRISQTQRELDHTVWTQMQPPNISGSIAAVESHRLEEMRKLLED